MTSAANGMNVDFYEQEGQAQSSEELLASSNSGATAGAGKIPTNWYMSAAAAAAAVAANNLPVGSASFLYSNDESLSNNSYNFQHKF
jgi:hypothetical protein